MVAELRKVAHFWFIPQIKSNKSNSKQLHNNNIALAWLGPFVLSPMHLGNLSGSTNNVETKESLAFTTKVLTTTKEKKWQEMENSAPSLVGNYYLLPKIVPQPNWELTTE